MFCGDDESVEDDSWWIEDRAKRLKPDDIVALKEILFSAEETWIVGVEEVPRRIISARLLMVLGWKYGLVGLGADIWVNTDVPCLSTRTNAMIILNLCAGTIAEEAHLSPALQTLRRYAESGKASPYSDVVTASQSLSASLASVTRIRNGQSD